LKRKNLIIVIPIVLVLAIGLTVPLLTPFLKPSSVVDPDRSPVNSNPYPDGTEANPTPLKIGQTIQIRIDVYGKAEYGVGPVVCNIFDITGPAPYEIVAVLFLENVGGNTWAKEWIVPNEYTYGGNTYQLQEGSKLKFYFASWDESEDYICPGPTTYGYISGYLTQSHPEGYFKINGKEATETSIHILFDPTVTFTFTVTDHPESIAAVKVSVNGEVLKLDKISNTEYRKSYTLPGPGTYKIEGWIVPTYDSSKQIVRMSIIMKYGESEFNRMALGLAILFATSAVILIIILRWFKK